MSKSVLVVAACIGLFIAGLIGFVSLIAGGIYFATVGTVGSAEGFLQNVAQGDIVAARQYLSTELGNAITDKELESFVEENSLDKYQSAFWNNRSVENNTGKLNGSISTTDGASIDLNMTFVNEETQWRIQRIWRNHDAGLGKQVRVELGGNEELLGGIDPSTSQNDIVSTTETSNSTNARQSPDDHEPVATDVAGKASHNIFQEIPSLQQAEKLVKDWTGYFCQGVSNQDFSEFHAKTAQEFQQQVPLNRFTNVFKRFLDDQLDLDWVQTVTPEFSTPPNIDAEGTLRLDGEFPADPPVKFEYSFLKQGGSWKLLKINLVVNSQTDQLVVPTLDVAIKLAQEHTARFGKAVRKQDFTDFHQSTSEIFKQDISLARFSTIFRPFIEQNVDLSWIGTTTPAFSAAPTLNTNGILSLKGHFPVQPKVNFEYDLIQENALWKITSINISVPPQDDNSEKSESENEIETTAR